MHAARHKAVSAFRVLSHSACSTAQHRMEAGGRLGTVLIVAPFCSIRPYIALGLALAERGWKVLIASTVENEFAINTHGFGRVGYVPLLGSLRNTLTTPASLKAIERGGSAALIDLYSQVISQNASTNYRLTWEAAGGSGADILIAGIHSLPECIAVGQKLNIPVAVAAAFPFDTPYESSSGHNLVHSARAVEWSAVSAAVNAFRATLGLRPQDHDETSFVPFVGGYSALFSPLPMPPPATAHSVSGFWRTPPEGYTSSGPVDSFLAAGAPVFVGFGDSVLPDPKAPFVAIAAALKRLNLRGLFAATPETGLTDLGDHVLVLTDKVPLEWVMARCSMAIHHGGPTSLAASTSAGIPTIVCPHLPPSYVAAHRIGTLGIGAVSFVPLIEVNAVNIEKAIQQALKPRVKELSRELGTRLQAEDGLPGATNFVHALVEKYKLPRKIRMEWQPDEEAENCNGCRASWTLFNRRHHCRSCGFIFCSQCATPTPLVNYRLPQLVCKNCVSARTRKPAAAAAAAAPKGAAAKPAAPVAQAAKPAAPAVIEPVAVVAPAVVAPSATAAPKLEEAVVPKANEAV